MAVIGDALRQAFMPRRAYDSLRAEDRAWSRLSCPILLSLVGAISFVAVVAVSVSLSIVFPDDPNCRPFCGDRRIQVLPVADAGKESEGYRYYGAFYLTDQEAADYYWMVIFVPSAIVFLFSAVYLFAVFIAILSLLVSLLLVSSRSSIWCCCCICGSKKTSMSQGC